MAIGTNHWASCWDYSLGLKVGTNHRDVFVGIGSSMFGGSQLVLGHSKGWDKFKAPYSPEPSRA